MPKLSALVTLASKLETEIKKMRQAMLHAHPASINAIRENVEQLEALYDAIMNRNVSSELGLEQLMAKGADCIRQCIQNAYSNKPDVIPTNIDYYAVVPDGASPTVEALHLLFYIDCSDSFLSYYNGKLGEEIRRLGNYLKYQKEIYEVDITYSLVWFSDSKSSRPYKIATYRESIENFVSDFNNIPQLPGSARSEGGMYAVRRTLTLVDYPTRPQALILVTDAPAQDEDNGVTKEIFEAVVDNNNISTRFAVIPFCSDPYIDDLFNDVRHISVYKNQYDLVPWGYRSLRQ